jgi:RNA polymerase sigma-70 factor, ECF subfamily
MIEPELHREDLALRDRVLAGDRAAAESLFERHIDALYEFVHYRLGSDRSHTEAIVQDTLLVGFRKLASFGGRSSLHTWLCGIAKNKVMAHRRKKTPIPLADVLAESDQEIDSILSTIETAEIPETILARRETRDLVGATLSSLPPEYRAALVAKYIEERSVAELATTLAKSEKAAESTLTRARVAFAKVFTLLARKRGGEE